MGGHRLAPSALLLVRRGADLLYFHDRDLAREFLFESSAAKVPCPVLLDPEADSAKDTDCELLHFGGDLTEVVNASLKLNLPSPGAALAAIRPLIDAKFANSLRNAIRARGAAAHPFPKARCRRLLQEVRNALSGARDDLDETRADVEFKDRMQESMAVDGSVKTTDAEKTVDAEAMALLAARCQNLEMSLQAVVAMQSQHVVKGTLAMEKMLDKSTENIEQLQVRMQQVLQSCEQQMQRMGERLCRVERMRSISAQQRDS